MITGRTAWAGAVGDSPFTPTGSGRPTNERRSVRTREKYDELLAGFLALHVQKGRRLFDLRWHRLPGVKVFSSPDKDGGWGDIEWPGVAAEDRPFDPAKRQVVGHLCLPTDDEGDRFTLGWDVVTMPKSGIAAEPVSGGKETVGERFRKLSALAGAWLPHQWHDSLSRFVSVLDDAPANWWYALLFAAYDDSLVKVGRAAGGELDLRDPLRCSADLIERLGLNTEQPKMPEDSVTTSNTGTTRPTAKPNKDEIMFGELEAYQDREVLRYLEGLQTRQSANTAAWLESLKSHRGYQALLKDSDWIRIKAEGQEVIEQYKQGRAVFKGRQWDDLTEAEKAKCEDLDAELHKRLFPLQQAMLKLRQGYGIPPAPDKATDADGSTPIVTPEQSEVNGGGTSHKGPGKANSTPKRQKRSTKRGEASDKIIAALTKHHEYENGGCLNQEPIGVRPLALMADVDPSTVTDFFNRKFDNGGKEGRAKYRAICRDSGRLADSIRALRGEFAPHDLYGRRPSGEDDRDDEE